MVNLGKSINREMYFGAKPELFKFAREMRNNPTECERILWKYLKKLRAEGFTFRRQHPIDIFIADFYCHTKKLVIEVDGEIHLDQQARDYDEGRTADLDKYGITVLRFKNNEVLFKIETVMEKISDYLSENSSPALLGAGDRRG
jgi:very-short-patch-repair endonuclease